MGAFMQQLENYRRQMQLTGEAPRAKIDKPKKQAQQKKSGTWCKGCGK